MTSLRAFCFALTAIFFTSFSVASAAADISIGGAVLKPGTYQWHPDARLRDAAVAGQVRADAWFLGAALLRDSAREDQQRLKAGVLFDLQLNKLHARAENDAALSALVERLDQVISPLAVTNRVSAQLNPFQLLVPRNNQLLQPGDQLLYPTRPDQVRVMGAVNNDCTLTFDASLALKEYLRLCPAHPAADRDTVYVIQPDGQIEQVGIAHWNEQPANIAVGAMIFRPIRTTVMSPETKDLNRDMARFLATQYQLGGRFQ